MIPPLSCFEIRFASQPLTGTENMTVYNGPLVKTISEKNFVNWLSVEIRLPPWYPYSAATEDRATVRTDLSAAPAET